jgi:hypothetical protein
MTATAVTRFEVGKTYEARSICDWQCVWAFTVIKRTAKFITVVNERGEESRVGVSIFLDEERARPMGRFAYAPVIIAGRETVR